MFFYTNTHSPSYSLNGFIVHYTLPRVTCVYIFHYNSLWPVKHMHTRVFSTTWDPAKDPSNKYFNIHHFVQSYPTVFNQSGARLKHVLFIASTIRSYLCNTVLVFSFRTNINMLHSVTAFLPSYIILPTTTPGPSSGLLLQVLSTVAYLTGIEHNQFLIHT